MPREGMPDASLEAMLQSAAVAETAANDNKAVEQEQAEASAQTQLGEKLQEHGDAFAEIAQIKKEREKADALLAKAQELIKDKENITPEMQAFLTAASDAEQARQDKLAQLEMHINDLSDDPAVFEALLTEAHETNRRKDLNREYYEVVDRVRHNLDFNGQHGMAYKRDIGGTHSQDSPKALLDMYGSMATGEWYEKKAPLGEAEGVVDIMKRIDAEASKPDADMGKIDSEYAQFLYERIQHFANTMNQRVETVAQKLADYYAEHSYEAEKYQVKDPSFEGWKQSLSAKLPNARNYMREAETIMKEPGLKAGRLAKLGETFGNQSYIASGMENNVFGVDEYKAKPSN